MQMTEPVSTIAVIEAAAAALGAVEVVGNGAGGDTGFNVGQCNVHYPAQFPPSQFAHGGQGVNWDVIKFHAHGGFWDNDLSISASGYLSQDHSTIVGHPGSAAPNVPVNRFVLLNFDKSGTSENMSRGLLTVNIGPWGGAGDIAEGTPEDPWIMLRVSGRFDPFGPGDMQYAFQLGVNSFGQISLGHVTYNGDVWDDFSITHQGDHVLVYIN
jgi:hypothetical protein